MAATATLEDTRKTALEQPDCKPEEATEDRSLRNRALGAAARYLEYKGYEILERNWPCDAGSIDIIARDEDDVLVFVDVQTGQGGFPDETGLTVNRSLFEALALAYLAEYEVLDVAVRFDSICIVPVAEDRAFLRHQVNALGAI